MAQREHRILSGLVLTVSVLIAIAGMFILYHIIDANQNTLSEKTNKINNLPKTSKLCRLSTKTKPKTHAQATKPLPKDQYPLKRSKTYLKTIFIPKPISPTKKL